MRKRFNNPNAIPEELDQKSWWTKIHLIALIGFLIRLVVALISDDVHHPDEIFQYLEQAHRLEFGYGVIPWEYRYGIRSWILPGLFSGLLHIFHRLHIDDPNLYVPIIKIFLCSLSISVIYASYIIVRNIASEKAGRLAAVFAVFWYELVYFSTKPTPEILSAYCLTLAVAFLVVKSTRKNTILFGFLVAASAVLRFQYLPAVFILIILAAFRWKKKEVLVFGFIFISTVVLAGYVDYLTWGSFFASYYNNYLYNSVYKVSEVFGVEPRLYYLYALIRNSLGILLIFGLLSSFPSKISKTWLLLLCVMAIVVPHSLIAHKEYRFIFGAIPFLVMLMAIVISDAISQLKHRKYTPRKIFLYSLLPLVFLISSGGLLLKLLVHGIHPPITTRTSYLSAYLFLHKNPNLVAVLNIHPLRYKTGGYYYLHRNVPIYYLDQIKTIQPNKYSSYVSHILCNQNDKPIPNFTPIVRYGDMEIREVINPPNQYTTLDVDTVNILQRGVDDRDDIPKPMFKLPSN